MTESLHLIAAYQAERDLLRCDVSAAAGTDAEPAAQRALAALDRDWDSSSAWRAEADERRSRRMARRARCDQPRATEYDVGWISRARAEYLGRAPSVGGGWVCTTVHAPGGGERYLVCPARFAAAQIGRAEVDELVDLAQRRGDADTLDLLSPAVATAGSAGGK